MNLFMRMVRYSLWSFCLPIAIIAQIPEKDFNTILHTLQTYDLDHADEAGYHYYISLISQVEEQGSQKQKDIVQSLSHHGNLPGQQQGPDPIARIEETLTSDVVTPAAWQEVINTIKTIEQQGSPQQQEQIKNLIQSEPAQRTIKNIVFSTLQSPDVRHMLKTVTIGTIYGVLPSVAFKAAMLLSGNIDAASASTALIDVGVLSALDALVRYATQNLSETGSAPVAAATSTAIQDFFGYVGPRPTDIPLFGPMGRPLLGMIQAAAITFGKQAIEQRGGIPTLLPNLNWRDMALGQENPQALVEHSTAFTFIKDNLASMIKNPTVRSAIATTVTYATEGAIMGAVLHSLGVGFYEETTIGTAMAQSMVRGALEGLYHFSAYREKPVGALQRLHGGFVAKSVQQFMQAGSASIGALAVTPIIINQLATSAVNSVVRTHNGWSGLVKSIFKR